MLSLYINASRYLIIKMFCFIHCLLGEREESYHFFFLNTRVHIKAFHQWVLHLVLKAVSVLTSYKQVFVPDVTDYQFKASVEGSCPGHRPGRSQTHLLRSKDSSHSAHLTILSCMSWLSFGFLGTSLSTCWSWLGISAGEWKQILKCSCISGMRVSIFSR